MATPAFNEYIECEGSGSTLLIGSDAIFCVDPIDLLMVAESAGSNLEADGEDGAIDRARSRRDLTVELRDVTIDGRFDQDGAAVASARTNLLSLMRTVANFWDDECTQRGFTLRLTEGTDEYVGSARFEQAGRWRPLGNSNVAVQVNLQITVAEGRLALVVP